MIFDGIVVAHWLEKSSAISWPYQLLTARVASHANLNFRQHHGFLEGSNLYTLCQDPKSATPFMITFQVGVDDNSPIVLRRPIEIIVTRNADWGELSKTYEGRRIQPRVCLSSFDMFPHHLQEVYLGSFTSEP